MQFLVDPVWSWPRVALASAVLLALVLWTYPRRVRHLSAGWRRLLIGLRVAAVVALIFAMLRPAIRFDEIDRQAAQLLVLLDSSRSMTTPDGPGGLTRRQTILKTLEDEQERLAELGEDVDIRFVDFSEEMLPTDEPVEEAEGEYTAIGDVIDELRREDTGKRIVGVVMMSDGAQRAPTDDAADPRLAARRYAEERGIPIHTVVYGTSELASAGLDLAVEDVLIRGGSSIFEKKTVPIEAQVRLLGAAGRKVRVRLLLEDRSGKGAGQSGELKPIPLAPDTQPFTEIETRENAVTVPVDLSFVATTPGEYKLAVEVVPDEGELKLSNNRIETLITVRKGGLRVAYFETPRTEQKFLRRLNETAEIQLDTQVVLPGPFQDRTRIDPRFFEPGAYDVYIIGDVPARVFVQDGINLLDRLSERLSEGAGLLMLGGQENFAAGGYASTRLAQWLPVDLEAPDASSQIKRPLKMIPTREGLQHYVMQVAGNNEQVWRELPEFSGATRLKPRSEFIDVLARTEDGVPLLMAADTGRARTAAFASDETYRWHLHGYEAVHQRFWQQLLLWLAHKEFDSDSQVWVRAEPRRVGPRSPVSFTFGARDEEGSDLPDATFEVNVVRPDGETVPVTPQRSGVEHFAEFRDTNLPGDYWVSVKATHDGEVLGIPALARFIVDDRDPEMDNPAADPDLMSEIAAITGTTPRTPEQFGDLLQNLIDAGVSTEITRSTQIKLWDGWPFLLVFVGLMSAEWFVRKTRGLV